MVVIIMNTLTSFLFILLLHVLLPELQCNAISPNTSRNVRATYTEDLEHESLDVRASELNILCSAGERYHEESNTCQKLGEQGACGERMVFLTDEENSLKAECECDYHNNLEPLVYHEATARCYSIFTQAYCLDKHWLVPEGRPPSIQFRCKENKCLKHSLANTVNFKELQHPYIVLHKGNCTTMFSEETCPADQVVTFNHDHPIPGCGPRPDTQSTDILPHSIAPRRLRCRPGSRRIITGKCVPSYHVPSAKPRI